MRHVAIWSLVLLGCVPAPAQEILYQKDRKVWLLSTRQSSYAMGVDENGSLRNLYWGAPIWRIEDIPAPQRRRDLSSFDPRQMLENEEFPGWGGPRYYEPAVKITRDDGNRDLVLKYVSHRLLNHSKLDIELKDISDDIRVTLHYFLYPFNGMLRRSATIRNGTQRPITVESAQSATWYLPEGDGYQLTYMTGRWAAESQLNHEPINQGEKVLESRKGHTSHAVNPWFAIDAGDASEENGRVWFGALAWSGNWRITVEQTQYRQVRVTGGYNTFDFSYPLKSGESLDTPEFFAGFSDAGYGGASRMMHRFEREQILPDQGKSRRPVLYNSWEATQFNVNEAGQKELATKAAKLGVELFVVDDGWFGKRNNDKAGLGDWFVNPEKFPQGLKGLIDHVTGLKMDFGIWVEPEMVNADSDLYRKHPDWVMNFPGRPRSELRNQMVLNLARNDVKEYLFGVLDDLLTRNNIRYLKWDMNRAFSEPGWPEVAPAEERKLWVDYVRNLYDLIDRLRAKHPRLEIESCSGGGGRVDLGILQRVDEVWPSDNTEAFDRLRIQEGFSQAYAPKVMSAWVTDVPNMNRRSTPLQYRFLVAMQGALGIGANLNRWTEEDNQQAAKMITLYKTIRDTVQTGDLYRLMSPRTGDITANEYASAANNQVVVFAFRHSQQYNTPAPTIRLRGLDERAVYRPAGVIGSLVPGFNEVSGAYLMHHGINLNLRGDYDSAAVVFERVP